MVETDAVINNKKGIHIRPSGLIFKAIIGYSGTITITKNGVKTQIGDIISILTLGLVQNDEIKIIVEGDNEETILDTLKGLFEKSFEFDEL